MPGYPHHVTQRGNRRQRTFFYEDDYHHYLTLVSDSAGQAETEISRRVGWYLERQGLLERDAENSYLTMDAVPEDSMNQLLGHSITYRIAVGPQTGRKVFTLQTLSACEPDDYTDTAGKVSGFSLRRRLAPSRWP